MTYRVIRDDRGRWGFGPDGHTSDPAGGAYRSPSEALDALRAALAGRGLAVGDVVAWGDGLTVEAEPVPRVVRKREPDHG